MGSYSSLHPVVVKTSGKADQFMLNKPPAPYRAVKVPFPFLTHKPRLTTDQGPPLENHDTKSVQLRLRY